MRPVLGRDRGRKEKGSFGFCGLGIGPREQSRKADKMKLYPTIQFQKSMMSNKSSDPIEGHLFDVEDEHFVAHKAGNVWYVSHFATGRLVDVCDFDLESSIHGFRLMFETNMIDLARLKEKAAALPILNRLPSG